MDIIYDFQISGNLGLHKKYKKQNFIVISSSSGLL